MTPEELAALHRACFATPPPWSAEAFAGMLAEPTVFLLVEPGGFLLGRAVADEAEILTLAVAREARRQGLALRLVAAFELEATRRGAGSGFLEVAIDNRPARAMYAKAGWERAGTRKAYFHTPKGRPLDAVVLRRDLPAKEHGVAG